MHLSKVLFASLFALFRDIKNYLRNSNDKTLIHFHASVSDEGGHDKHSKKELLGGKRKDKKDRKDRGYATLEGESSPDEDQETK